MVALVSTNMQAQNGIFTWDSLEIFIKFGGDPRNNGGAGRSSLLKDSLNRSNSSRS